MTVSISDGFSRLELARTGDPDEHYTASSYLTNVAVVSGPFSVIVEAHARTFASFLQALSQLHQSMAGEAKLDFWNEEHSIILKGDGRGGLQIDATITDGRTPCSAYLRVGIVLDQSYLPGIISELREEFPIE